MVRRRKEKKDGKKFKRTIEDVFGWKVFIFLPQNFLWRFFIVTTIVISYVINTVKIFYQVTGYYAEATSIICDLLYFLDSLCATLHYFMVNTRKLKHGKLRPLLFLLIDYISLIPFNMVYNFLIYNDRKGMSDYLRFNTCLRIYQIYTCFSDVKLWIYQVGSYFFVTFLEIAIYNALIVHFLSCILFIVLNADFQQKCLNDIVACITENELLTFSLLCQSYSKPFFQYPLFEIKLIIIIDFLVGYVFSYGYIVPLLVFVFMKYLRGLFEFSNKIKQIKLLINHTVQDKKLSKKILNYFYFEKKFGKGSSYPEAIEVFPISFRKNIFCDLHWDVFRHSELLQSLSINCKKTLSLYMKTDFIDAQTILLRKNDVKKYFMYLESGILQIMAEENNQSPVISFSGGTVFGESVFFYQTKSKAILQTAKFSIIHFLEIKKFFSVLLDYPKDMKKIHKKMRLRMKLAMASQKRKTKICPEFTKNEIKLTALSNEDKADVKWVKQQFRIISELHKYQNTKNKSNQKDANYEHLLQQLKTQLEHSSVYLPLLVINDEVINKYEAVCLKISFPWLVDPQSNFLKLWNLIIVLVALNATLMYPVFLGWYPYLPNWFYDITVVTTFLYIIDVFIQLSTAVKFKNIIVAKFKTVFLHRLTSLSFFADVAAALPLHTLIQFSEDQPKPFVTNLYISIALIKTYRVIVFFHKWNYHMKSIAVSHIVLKYVFIISVSIFWFSAILNLTSVQCVFFNCRADNWTNIKDDYIYSKAPTLYFSVFMTFDIPYRLVNTKVIGTHLTLFAGFTYFRYLFFICQSEIISAYNLENSHSLKYKSLIAFVLNFMQSNKIVGRIRKRVVDTMVFHWNYDYGDYVTDKQRVFDEIDEKLKEEIDQNSIIHTISRCRLFESEDSNFHAEVCKRVSRLALPKGSVLNSYASRVLSFYILHRGSVQVNSFSVKDLVNNVGTPVLIKSGSVFPLIGTVSQLALGCNARTLTDCELLKFNLEDFLELLVKHGIFKDLVDAVKATDFSSVRNARLALSKVADDFQFDKKSYLENFHKLKCLGVCLRYVLLKKTINSLSSWYVKWEFFRVFCILLSLMLWPNVFGAFSNVKVTELVTFLLIVDSIFWIDCYIRLHVIFYDSKGLSVTHPLNTSIHYLTSSFITDCIAFTPYFHILFFPPKKITGSLTIFLIHVILRLFSLYRFFGVLKYINDTKQLFQLTVILKYVILYLIVLNFGVNITFYLYNHDLQKLSFEFDQFATDLEPRKHVAVSYIQEQLITIFITLKVPMDLKHMNTYCNSYIIFFILCGWAIEIFLICYLTLNSSSINVNFTTYQYYIKNFMKFLTVERADDSIANEAVKYFEYEWEKKKGEDLHKIFSRFPHVLHEDLMFPLYAETFSAVQCLSGANEAFYRILSRYVTEMYLTKESIVLFSNQVQEDIYFIHKGQCCVKEFSKTLYRGSMIGDIRRKGFMNNTIVAETHVTLLKMTSKVFFLTINNFHKTKKAFDFQVSNVEDFVESIYYKIEKTDITTLKKEEEVGESEFEAVGDRADNDRRYLIKKNIQNRGFHAFGNPYSLVTRVLNVVFLVVAYTTIIVIPVLIAIRLTTIITLIFLYVLDCIWILKIVKTLKTSYFDPKTGHLISNSKAIFRWYLHHGLILDIISILPFEIIPLICFAIAKNYDHCLIINVCFAPRLLRYFYFLRWINKKKKKLAMNFMFRLISIVGLRIVKLMIVTCICLQICFRTWDFFGKCFWSYNSDQLETLWHSFLCVTNTYVGGELNICKPTTVFDEVFTLVVAVWGVFSKAFLVNEMLAILHVTLHTKYEQMHKLEELEKFLTVRGLSPSLFQGMRRYFCDLMDTCKETAMPLFLIKCPTSIRVDIMKDIYMSHLTSCYVFQGLEEFFLKQLASRLERYIFFPGDYILEKGDVDWSMYFIHKGEIYCLEMDKEYKTLGKVVDLFIEGENFGVLQGILFGMPHTNTYRAKTLVDVLVLSNKNWGDLRLAFPEITRTIFTRVTQYEM